MKKRFALALVAASLVAAGCSSDDDDDDATSPVTTDGDNPMTVDPDAPSTTDGDGTTTDGVDPDPADPGSSPTTGAGGVTTDGPLADAGPVELAVANDPELSSFYSYIDAIFGGETIDERDTPEEEWTFLIPTNDAFDAAGLGDTPDADRGPLLQRHVITSGKLTQEELAGLSEIVVNSGDSYPIAGDATSLSIGGANVLRVVGEDDNTIVYAIDGALGSN